MGVEHDHISSRSLALQSESESEFKLTSHSNNLQSSSHGDLSRSNDLYGQRKPLVLADIVNHDSDFVISPIVGNSKV